jgi:hypothetical protein
MNVKLRSDEFAAFFYAVHGYKPFPWQMRLAKRVFSDGWADEGVGCSNRRRENRRHRHRNFSLGA